MSSTASPDQTASVRIRAGDVSDERDRAAAIELINQYASGLAGRMRPLDESVISSLIKDLPGLANCRVFLAEVGDRPVGVAMCFVGYSTFKGAPLLNIHDLAVHPDFQRRGIGSQLLTAAIEFAREQKFCSVTLEVQADNPARQLYARRGFKVLDVPADPRATLFGKLALDEVATIE